MAGALLLSAAAAGQDQPATPPHPPPLLPADRGAPAEAILRDSPQQKDSPGDAAYLSAYTLLREGKAKEALAAYTRAASFRNPSAADLRNVAQAYVLLGDYPDGEKWLTTSLRMDPNSPDTWYNLGRLHYLQNRFAEAVDCFRKTLALAPQSVKAENNLGLAFEGLDRIGDAEVAYRQALAWQDAGPPGARSEQPLLNLAILLLHSPDPAEVPDLLLRAESIAPRDPRIHEQLGQLYLQEAKYQQAVNELRTATDADPGRSSLHFLLGQAYRHLGQQQQASAQFAEAARLAKVSQD